MSNQSPADAAVIAQIEATDAQRVRATLGKDRAALEQLIGDDLLYVHSSGVPEHKSLYLERVTNGHYDYKGLDYSRREFRVLGDTVLVDGDLNISLLLKGTPRAIVSRFLQVWTRRDGRWQMVSWQSTLMPAAT